MPPFESGSWSRLPSRAGHLSAHPTREPATGGDAHAPVAGSSARPPPRGKVPAGPYRLTTASGGSASTVDVAGEGSSFPWQTPTATKSRAVVRGSGGIRTEPCCRSRQWTPCPPGETAIHRTDGPDASSTRCRLWCSVGFGSPRSFSSSDTRCRGCRVRSAPDCRRRRSRSGSTHSCRSVQRLPTLRRPASHAALDL